MQDRKEGSIASVQCACMPRSFIIALFFFAVCVLALPFINLLVSHFRDYNWPPKTAQVRYPCLVFFALFYVAYFFLLRVGRHVMTWQRGYVFLFLLLGIYACTTYPVFSIDLYEYISRGRIMTVYQANPYKVAPEAFPGDIFYSIIFWKNQALFYGPAWAWISCIPAKIAGNDVFLNQFLMKLVLLLFYAAGGYLIYLLAQGYGKKRPALIAQAFLLNPYMIVTTLLDGHNDIVVVFFVLLALLALQRGRWVWSIVCLCTSVWVKMMTALFIPFFCLYVLVSAKGLRAKTRAVLNIFMALLIPTLIFFWPFRDGIMQWLATFRTVAFSWHDNTITYMLYKLLGFAGLRLDQHTAMRMLQGVFLVLYVFVFFKFWRGKKRGIISSLFLVLALYFPLMSFQFGSWYILWIVPFIILSDIPLPVLLVDLITFAALISFWKKISYLLIAAMLVYLAVLVYIRIRAKSRLALRLTDAFSF